jgi:hypothetical protein
MSNYVLHSDFNVTLSEAKSLKSFDGFFVTLRVTFWAKPIEWRRKFNRSAVSFVNNAIYLSYGN